MSKPDEEPKPTGSQEAEDLALAAEHGSRAHGSGWWSGMIALIAGCWSLFQLSLPAPFMPLIESTYVRSIHLAFAMCLVFLSFPAAKSTDWRQWGRLARYPILWLKRPWAGVLTIGGLLLFMLINPRWEADGEEFELPGLLRWVTIGISIGLLLSIHVHQWIRPWVQLPKRSLLLKWLSTAANWRWLDALLAIVATLAALYIVLDYEGLAMRQGALLERDLWIGLGLILLLLEAARRSLGPALPLIALTFIGYRLISESDFIYGLTYWLSEDLNFIVSIKSASPEKLINQLCVSTEGIYGIPLGVSASTVFLFVLFGAMLDKAGGGKFFTDLAFSLVGRFRGGPAKASVLASGMTGLVSGSSIANTVTTGTFTIPLMRQAGYPATKSGAVEVAASTNGQLMPPIMGAAAFIIAEYCNISYVEVIRAAIVPALVSYLALIYITHLEAKKLALAGIPKDQLPFFWKTLKRGMAFLIPLSLLMYLLVVEQQSPEKAVFIAIIGLAMLIGGQQLLGIWRQQHTWQTAIKKTASLCWSGLVDGGRNMMAIGVAVAAAGIIGGIVTLGLGTVITDLIDLLAGDHLVLLLIITAVASLILGMGLPTTANYIVMASITAPVIVNLGGDLGLSGTDQQLLIAAHLFCFYFGILADDTPPVGLAAYAAAAISKADPIKTGLQGFLYDMRTAILPFAFIFNLELLLLGVESWSYGIVIFITALIGMFAFCNASQFYFLARTRWYEWPLFLCITALMLRPDLLAYYTDWPQWTSWLIGIGVYVVAGALQWRRRFDNEPATAAAKPQ